MFKQLLTVKNALTLLIIMIFLQFLFLDLNDSYKNLYIFNQLGNLFDSDWLSLYGAYVIGGAEFIAILFLLSPWHIIGAILALVVTSGMILFHLATPLGVAIPIFNIDGRIVGDDGARMFIMTCFMWICSFILIIQDIRPKQKAVND